jgi:hypothetical protein
VFLTQASGLTSGSSSSGTLVVSRGVSRRESREEPSYREPPASQLLWIRQYSSIVRSPLHAWPKIMASAKNRKWVTLFFVSLLIFVLSSLASKRPFALFWLFSSRFRRTIPPYLIPT